jgi:3-phosphoshikimate 1-carboxyvinyltransferase
MHERPQTALFQALRELGYRIDSANDKLPALIHGGGPRSKQCQISIEESSQFASALLLSLGIGKWQVRIVGENAEESHYVEMTKKLCKSFPIAGGEFAIEPDASSGSYFWAANWLAPEQQLPSASISSGKLAGVTPEVWQFSDIDVKESPMSKLQVDERFSRLSLAKGTISRTIDLGDSIMTAVMLAPFAPKETKFTDLGRLRVQECERVVALRTELTKCGVRVVEEGDTLTVFPSPPHGATIETYNDHRMAMCFAILGLKVPGIKIKNPACVKKTFPNFFQKLAAAPPRGLGAKILDPSGRPLAHDELFAE